MNTHFHVPSTGRRAESSDAAGLIVALLVRFPEIATIVSRPSDHSVELSFVVSRPVAAGERNAIHESLHDHIHALLELGKSESQPTVELSWEMGRGITFLRLVRDARSLSREELAMTVSLLSTAFAGRLILAPIPDDAGDDDPAHQDELVDVAIDSLRDPASQNGLVGLREEKRVVVYFHAPRKKAKARPRS